MRCTVEKAKINRFNTLMPRVFIIVSCVWATLIFGSMDARNLLWSNAVIALAASGCVIATLCLSGADLESRGTMAFAMGIGSATWLAYTWQRHVKSTRPGGLRPTHLQWHRRNWTRLRVLGLLLLPMAAMPAGLTAALQSTLDDRTPVVVGLALLVSAAVTLLYAGLPGERGMRHALRRMPGIKMVWIAGAWGTVTALWPLWWASGAGSNLPPVTPWLWTERFLIIAALTLPFDLRDAEWDPASMRTWPQLLGPQATRSLAILMVLAAACIRWHVLPDPTALLGPAVMAVAVARAGQGRAIGYYGLLDGLLILDALALLLV